MSAEETDATSIVGPEKPQKDVFPEIGPDEKRGINQRTELYRHYMDLWEKEEDTLMYKGHPNFVALKDHFRKNDYSSPDEFKKYAYAGVIHSLKEAGFILNKIESDEQENLHSIRTMCRGKEVLQPQIDDPGYRLSQFLEMSMPDDHEEIESQELSLINQARFYEEMYGIAAEIVLEDLDKPLADQLSNHDLFQKINEEVCLETEDLSGDTVRVPVMEIPRNEDLDELKTFCKQRNLAVDTFLQKLEDPYKEEEFLDLYTHGGDALKNMLEQESEVLKILNDNGHPDFLSIVERYMGEGIDEVLFQLSLAVNVSYSRSEWPHWDSSGFIQMINRENYEIRQSIVDGSYRVERIRSDEESYMPDAINSFKQIVSMLYTMEIGYGHIAQEISNSLQEELDTDELQDRIENIVLEVDPQDGGSVLPIPLIEIPRTSDGVRKFCASNHLEEKAFLEALKNPGNIKNLNEEKQETEVSPRDSTGDKRVYYGDHVKEILPVTIAQRGLVRDPSLLEQSDRSWGQAVIEDVFVATEKDQNMQEMPKSSIPDSISNQIPERLKIYAKDLPEDRVEMTNSTDGSDEMPIYIPDKFAKTIIQFFVDGNLEQIGLYALAPRYDSNREIYYWEMVGFQGDGNEDFIGDAFRNELLRTLRSARDLDIQEELEKLGYEYDGTEFQLGTIHSHPQQGTVGRSEQDRQMFGMPNIMNGIHTIIDTSKKSLLAFHGYSDRNRESGLGQLNNIACDLIFDGPWGKAIAEGYRYSEEETYEDDGEKRKPDVSYVGNAKTFGRKPLARVVRIPELKPVSVRI
jgi:hypothetical protein